MKKIISAIAVAFVALVLALPFALMAAKPAHAGDSGDSGACYSIANADQRAYCIAKARKETSACYSIQNGALRSQCLAEVR